ncbi:hypothetical protein [Thalassobellus sediminis]|uniref:hypothetical protein n=1 Tax=Thalassobellus sediminis TaxID=3367753 RepID=UPI003799E729
MKYKQIKKKLILGILFLLPVMFVFIMSISTENYKTLDIVETNINDFYFKDNLDIKLKDHLTVLAFFGKSPMSKSIEGLNLKEIVYDKFKGFKKFQIVVLVPIEARNEAEELFREISSYEDLRFWHFVFLEEYDIQNIFKSLKSDFLLDENFASDKVFIIDTDLNQRGRLDDRSDDEKANNKPIYGLNFYSCIEVAELKNKMSAEDLRVLFTEYRQKRKGDFNSDTRRASDLNGNVDN